MALKSKRYYAEQAISAIQNDYPNIDFKIDERKVFVQLDNIVNELARASYFENWKLSGTGISEQFITTWENVTVVDQTDGKPSSFTIPLNYADLPKERGIDEVWPIKYSEDNNSVIILNRKDVRMLGNNPAGNMQGRLSGFVKSNQFIFNNPNNGCGIKAKYGNMNIALVVRDSSQIPLDAPYPVPASSEAKIIERLIEFFVLKRNEPTDTVRDNNDKA